MVDRLRDRAVLAKLLPGAELAGDLQQQPQQSQSESTRACITGTDITADRQQHTYEGQGLELRGADVLKQLFSTSTQHQWR